MDDRTRKELEKRGQLVPVVLVREQPGLAKRASRLPVIRTVVAGILAVPIVLRFALVAAILSTVTVAAMGQWMGQWRDVHSIVGSGGSTPPVASGWSPGYGQGSASECTNTITDTAAIETAANALNPGEVLCLRGGVYPAPADDKTINLTLRGTTASPTKIKGYPGERAEVRGSFQPADTGSNWIIEGLYVDASYSTLREVPVGTTTRWKTDWAFNFKGASNIILQHVEFVNRRGLTNNDTLEAGTCIFGGNGSNNVVRDSYVHHCGNPAQDHEHCSYLGNAVNITIRDNYMFNCANRAVQIYPGVNGADIFGNVLDFSNSAHTIVVLNDTASNTRFDNNVTISRNTAKTYNVGAVYSGTSNRLLDNCLSPTAASLGTSNVTQSGSLVVSPAVTVSNTLSGATRTVKVEHADCAGKLPVGSRFRP